MDFLMASFCPPLISTAGKHLTKNTQECLAPRPQGTSRKGPLWEQSPSAGLGSHSSCRLRNCGSAHPKSGGFLLYSGP